MIPFLTDAEVAEVCSPLHQPAAQVRFLTGLGLLVKRKPNGRPLVARTEFERAMVTGTIVPAANDTEVGPDPAALQAYLSRNHGPKEKRH